MGHGGGAYFAFNGFLLEVAEGDIAPNIPVQVNQDGVEATDGIEQLGDVVVGLDLGGVGVPAQAQAFYELLGIRSEEHTSELQSRENIVCRLLLEKKKTIQRIPSS